MVKLNDSFSGEGNAVLRIDEELQNALKDWSLYCLICLMVQKSADHQLRLVVVYPIIPEHFF